MSLFSGESQINVHIENCDRLRITVDFATLLMTRPGGTHSNISMKVGKPINFSNSYFLDTNVSFFIVYLLAVEESFYYFQDYMTNIRHNNFANSIGTFIKSIALNTDLIRVQKISS